MYTRGRFACICQSAQVWSSTPRVFRLPLTCAPCLVPRFSIKGQAGEDAVLCTEDRTYVVRSVTLSNSVLVVTRDAEDDWDDLGGTVVIRDTVNEILELTPTVPKLQKLSSLLQGREYTGDEDDENEVRKVLQSNMI